MHLFFTFFQKKNWIFKFFCFAYTNYTFKLLHSKAALFFFSFLNDNLISLSYCNWSHHFVQLQLFYWVRLFIEILLRNTLCNNQNSPSVYDEQWVFTDSNNEKSRTGLLVLFQPFMPITTRFFSTVVRWFKPWRFPHSPFV